MSEGGISGYQSRGLIYIARRRYQAMTSEDLVLALLIFKVCSLVKLLKLFVVRSYKLSINSIINRNPVFINS
jgi:hypothetical protein